MGLISGPRQKHYGSVTYRYECQEGWLKNWIFALSLGAMICAGSGAYAQTDGNQQVIAQQGDWVAGSYSPSLISSPTVCIGVSDTTPSFGFRADDQGNIDIRMQDSDWSLPANASGNIKVSVNGHSYAYPGIGMSASEIDASITQDQLTALVGDMEIASSMQVTVGSSAPTTIPLDGSQVVLTAFMTCAGINNPSKNTGGSNPFASSSSN